MCVSPNDLIVDRLKHNTSLHDTEILFEKVSIERGETSTMCAGEVAVLRFV